MAHDREAYAALIRNAPPAGGQGIPAATVIVMRDGAAGPETLMLRRNAKLAFVGGAWVFPGGRVDPADRDGARDDLEAARRAALREAREEAGIEIAADSLVPFSHWTPPSMTPRRFLTWFFIAPAPAGEVCIDDGEIKDHCWMDARRAMQRRNAGEIELAPPTWISLERLATYDSVAHALADSAGRPPDIYETRIALTDEGPVALYDGDAGYASGDPTAPGARHRLEMRDSGWVYLRDA